MSGLARRLVAAISRAIDVASRSALALAERAASPVASVALLLIFVALFLIDGFMGVDFGQHWDEWYHVQGVAGCIQRTSLLPEGLSYGGPYFTLGFPVVLAHQWPNVRDILREMRTQPFRVDPSAFPAVARFKAEATALLNTTPYLVEVRSVFVGLTALAIVWMFLASLRCMPRRPGVALATAGLLAFSWELGYHARWIAIDAPLAQFCALELFCFCAAWRAPSEGPTVRWYCAAAAAAGAVFACKLTGLFAYLPILLLPLVRQSSWSLVKRLRIAALGTALFVLCSFALSPEFYLDPLHLLNVFRSGSADYNTTPTSYPHYVGVTEHVLRMLMWYFWVFPSPYLTLAVLFSVLALLGLATLLRRETRMTLTWLTFMLAFIGVFTHNHLLIVRQYLMCTPFLALCFGRGCAAAWDFLRARDRRLAAAFVTLVALGFAVNGLFELRQAWRITRDDESSIDKALTDDLLAHPAPVRLSHRVFERMNSFIAKGYDCRAADVKQKTISHFIAYAVEHEWPANRLYVFNKVYGAAEVNMNFYSFWLGRIHGVRLVDVPMENMVKLGRDMSGDVDCFPKGHVPPRVPSPVGQAGAGGGH